MQTEVFLPIGETTCQTEKPSARADVVEAPVTERLAIQPFDLAVHFDNMSFDIYVEMGEDVVLNHVA